MNSLVHFVRARILDDEAEARAAEHRGANGPWSSRRILAECAAKRAVLAALERDHKKKSEEQDWDWLDEEAAFAWLFGDSKADESKKLAREILRALAQPYADHPDYQQDWFASPRRIRRPW
ncbi:DUF6221 family protein [Nocardia sp. NPDC052316]|uniref:DUF6221 family protein n=1 Tax=Nocardia sp. NPDC052316 TaxID=3364329 RepID=UPI0037C5E6DA